MLALSNRVTFRDMANAGSKYLLLFLQQGLRNQFETFRNETSAFETRKLILANKRTFLHIKLSVFPDTEW